MFVFRLIELKTRREFFSSFRKKSDIFILKIWKSIYYSFDSVTSRISDELHKIPRIIAHFVSDIWEFMTERSSKYSDLIRGKKVLKNKGSASFFISSVAEYKKELKKDLHN